MYQVAWSGVRKEIFRPLSQFVICPLFITRGGGVTLFRFIADRQAGKLRIPIFSL